MVWVNFWCPNPIYIGFHLILEICNAPQFWLGYSHSSRKGPSWSWSYGSLIYNYLCNQCPSTLKLWVWILLMVRCTQIFLITTLCDKVHRFAPPNKTDRHNIIEILLKVTSNTITIATCWLKMLLMWQKNCNRYWLIYCNKVSLSVTCGRSVIFSRFSCPPTLFQVFDRRH
jgi:hypothetical protein